MAPLPLHLDRPAVHLPVAPGSTIVVRGSFYNRQDGSVVDAANTFWPAAAPGGASVAPGGLCDFGAGGFDVVAIDAEHHEITAVATGAASTSCAALGVDSPCLILRTRQQAHARLATVADWSGSLRGMMQVEIPSTRPVSGAAASQVGSSSYSGVVILSLVLSALVALGWLSRRFMRTARYRLGRQLRRVARVAARVDPVLFRVLQPALRATARALRSRRLDASSREGRRLEQALAALEADLRAEARRQQRAAERQVAEQLAQQVVFALEAAAEVSLSKP